MFFFILTNHNIDWDTAQYLTYSTNYFQRLTLESWYTNLEQTPLNRCQPLPTPYKRLIHDVNKTDERTTIHVRSTDYNKRIENKPMTDDKLYTSLSAYTIMAKLTRISFNGPDL